MREPARLDAFDLRLLAALQENGRLTNQELGERIGLSASQCSRRRAGLEGAGLIRGYRADLAAGLIGFRLNPGSSRAVASVVITHSARSAASGKRRPRTRTTSGTTPTARTSSARSRPLPDSRPGTRPRLRAHPGGALGGSPKYLRLEEHSGAMSTRGVRLHGGDRRWATT